MNMSNPPTIDSQNPRRANIRTMPSAADTPPDPRTAPGFVPQLYPAANGLAESIGGADPHNEVIAREFLAAYYAINVRSRQLIELRARPRGTNFPRLERAALQAIETALIQRDELEDRYAPFGVLAEPEARDGVTVNVRFTFGSTDAAGRFRAEPIVSSAFLEFRVPENKRGRSLTPPGARSITGATGPSPCES